jgi:LysR family transcriptional regulator, glycine cleavage system transcriptional activator
MRKSDTKTTQQLLPLNAIQVFVHAAQQRSFSRAGLTLGMSQSGVSRHVAGLEKYLGQALFIRAGASVKLTDAGRLYFDNVQEALATIELTTRQLAHRPTGPAHLLVRTSLPSFAMAVLIPSLPRFFANTGTAVDVVTSLSAPEPGEPYDVLISRDLLLQDAEQWLLTIEKLVCVAAPALHREWAIKSFKGRPFLSAKSRPDTLALWSERQHASTIQLNVVGSFDHYFLAIAAAVAGMGYLVVPHILVGQALQLGHLLEVPLPSVRGSASYNAYVNPLSRQTDTARSFCRWLKSSLTTSATLSLHQTLLFK